VSKEKESLSREGKDLAGSEKEKVKRAACQGLSEKGLHLKNILQPAIQIKAPTGKDDERQLANTGKGRSENDRGLFGSD